MVPKVCTYCTRLPFASGTRTQAAIVAAFGGVVAGVGDVSGDGVPDILVGAPFQDVGGSDNNQGQAFVFSGADGRPLQTLTNPTPQSQAFFGSAVAGVGDVTGDGVPDLLVGAPGQDVGSNQNQGQAFIFAISAATVVKVPLRWCGVEGSPSMTNPAVVGETSQNGVLLRRLGRANGIYAPQTTVAFRSGVTPLRMRDFPVIADPNTKIGAPGDVSLGRFLNDLTLLCHKN